LREHLSNIREWRYKIYLQVGNMSDILNMTFSDFNSIIKQMIYENKPIDHKIRKLSNTQLKMIERRKEQKR
jgi:hypothetical protein